MIIEKFNSKIFCKEPIVDVEIGNDISQGWDYTKSDIVTVGIIFQNKITIIQRKKEDDLNEFKEVVIKELDNTPPFSSFNFNMERGSFLGFLNKEYYVKEIKPFKGRGWSKDKFFSKLKEWNVEILDEFNDPFKGDSSLCIKAYQEGDYFKIIEHNKNCLLKEANILTNKGLFLEKLGHKINNQGWYTE